MVKRRYSNFPLLFERVSDFLKKFKELEQLKPNSPEFLEKYNKLVGKCSPSNSEVARQSFDEIHCTLYPDSVKDCLGIPSRGKS